MPIMLDIMPIMPVHILHIMPGPMPPPIMPGPMPPPVHNALIPFAITSFAELTWEQLGGKLDRELRAAFHNESHRAGKQDTGGNRNFRYQQWMYGPYAAVSDPRDANARAPAKEAADPARRRGLLRVLRRQRQTRTPAR